MKVKEFGFLIEGKNGRKKKVYVTSKHLGGAVRKMYQENEVEKVIKIYE